MFSRRRYMRRTVLAVDSLLAPRADAEGRVLRARARAYARDCGCAMGGAFMLAGLLVSAAWLATSGIGVARALLAGALILGATALGKATGLLIATVRLALLRRSIPRRPGGRHVDVHQMGH